MFSVIIIFIVVIIIIIIIINFYFAKTRARTIIFCHTGRLQ